MPSIMALPLLRQILARPTISCRSPLSVTAATAAAAFAAPRTPLRLASALPSSPLFSSASILSQTGRRAFSSTPPAMATLNQVLRGCRKPRRSRHTTSPALAETRAPMMKGVCIKVGITRPKKPNSGERKTARVRLSNGRMITAYIPGEGHNIQQHSVVLVRGGRTQDCPGVLYHLVRGALDLGGVSNRISSRSKYGTKKPKTASVG